MCLLLKKIKYFFTLCWNASISPDALNKFLWFDKKLPLAGEISFKTPNFTFLEGLNTNLFCIKNVWEFSYFHDWWHNNNFIMRKYEVQYTLFPPPSMWITADFIGVLLWDFMML